MSNSALADLQYFVDTDESELSILRMDKGQLNQRSENVDSMVQTATALGASFEVIQELQDLARNNAVKDTELYSNEQQLLDTLLAATELNLIGILPNVHGITFGMGAGHGDGTLPTMRLRNIVQRFTEVLSTMRSRGFGDLTFNGVVYLKSNDDKTGVVLHVYNSVVTVQRPKVVWENIDLCLEEEKAPVVNKARTIQVRGCFE